MSSTATTLQQVPVALIVVSIVAVGLFAVLLWLFTYNGQTALDANGTTMGALLIVFFGLLAIGGAHWRMWQQYRQQKQISTDMYMGSAWITGLLTLATFLGIILTAPSVAAQIRLR